MTSVFKYRSDYDRDIALLKQAKIYAPTIEKLNDPTEGLIEPELVQQLRMFGPATQKVLESFESLLEKQRTLGIYSLSTSVTDELLWAHYADSHRGFCIEYDLELLVDLYLNHGSNVQFANVMKIDYQPKPPIVTIADIGRDKNDLFMKKLIGTKSKRWKYEDEIRILFENSGENPFDFRATKSVTFGLRSDPASIRTFIETFPYELNVYAATLSGTYDFGRKLIGRTISSAAQTEASTEYLLLDDDNPDYHRYSDQIAQAIGIVTREPHIVDVFYAGLERLGGRQVIRVNANRDRAFSPWPVKFFYFSIEKDGRLKTIERPVKIG